MTTNRPISAAADVTPEILEIAESVVDGWYADGRVDWEDFVDRMDDVELADGMRTDFGEDMNSPAVRKIKSYVRKYRAS